MYMYSRVLALSGCQRNHALILTLYIRVNTGSGNLITTSHHPQDVISRPPPPLFISAACFLWPQTLECTVNRPQTPPLTLWPRYTAYMCVWPLSSNLCVICIDSFAFPLMSCGNMCLIYIYLGYWHVRASSRLYIAIILAAFMYTCVKVIL